MKNSASQPKTEVHCKYNQNQRHSHPLHVYYGLMVFYTVITLSFYSCNNNSKKNNSNIDSIATARVQKFKDSIENEILSKKDEVKPELISKNIQIINFYTSEPNSAGGVDCNIIWKNTSSKVVKYARFTVTPYNAVDDVMKSEIGGASTKTLESTGPINPGVTDGYGTIYTNVWYNSSISKMKITAIELEYMDGSIVSTGNKEILNSVLPRGKRN